MLLSFVCSVFAFARGIIYGQLGEATQERDLLERSLAIQERAYGPEDGNVAVTLANLGNAYDRLGDIVRQRELLERALRINEREYGKDDHAVPWIESY